MLIKPSCLNRSQAQMGISGKVPSEYTKDKFATKLVKCFISHHEFCSEI